MNWENFVSDAPFINRMLSTVVLIVITLVACKMAAGLMKLNPADAIDGVTIQTAEEFLKQAVECKILLYT